MSLYRLKNALRWPFRALYARLQPVAYARMIGVTIKGRVTIYGSSYKMFSSEPYLVTLHDNVFISVDAQFICHDGGVLPFRSEFPRLDLAGPIVVKSNCFIGAGASIMRGVTIGENCVVAAHAVVTKDVPDGSVVGGNPAKVIKSTQAYLEGARERSLNIGHLYGEEKAIEYKRIFNIGAR
ncbi:acyltransferase [Pelagerythrobacter aerophilus]|uniref:Acyltransferase n=1 Tax=Pelagerythrobacter aerophilus TaxID=2306995 RepID=A0A418NE24_9SPHN|nr:acyltransferase [Pelagerythrobacter aerophilus]RIV76041.1 acyltransferase [Pelagerythrobacter aerophilus]RIV80704.1 acyltransferase [Pelagerythrobacter aerophilus]